MEPGGKSLLLFFVSMLHVRDGSESQLLKQDER